MSLEVAASADRPDAVSSAAPTKTLFISRSLQSFYRLVESARAFRSSNFDAQDTSAIPGKYTGPCTNKILMSFLGRFWDCSSKYAAPAAGVKLRATLIPAAGRRRYRFRRL